MKTLSSNIPNYNNYAYLENLIPHYTNNICVLVKLGDFGRV